MEVKWDVYLLSAYGLLSFNLDFNQLSLVCTEEIANANERQRRIIQLK